MPGLSLYISNPNNRTDANENGEFDQPAMQVLNQTEYQWLTNIKPKTIACNMHGSKAEDDGSFELSFTPRTTSLSPESIDQNAYLTNDILFDEIFITGLELSQKITSVKLFIDETEIPVNATPIEQTENEVRLRIKYHSKNNSSRLLMHHSGLIQLIFLVKMQNDLTEIWHTKYIQVYHRTDPYRYTENHIASASRMLQYLINNESNFLNIQFDNESLQDDSLPGEIFEFEKVFQTLEKQLPFFASSPATQMAQDTELGRINQFRGLNNQTSAFIATHPQYLTRSLPQQGIHIQNNTYAFPQKLLITKTKHDFDLFENRAILAFINSTIEFLKIVIHKYSDITNNPQYHEIIGMLPTPPENLEGYLTTPDSNGCIQALFKDKFSSGLVQLNVLLSKFMTLRMRFEHALHLSALQCGTLTSPGQMNSKHIAFLTSSVPPKLKLTLIFRDKPHYRIIYNLINSWLNYWHLKRLETVDTFDPQKYANILQLMQLPSTDRLYEYYCLTLMLNILKNNSKLRFQRCESFKYRNPELPIDQFINTKSQMVYTMYIDTTSPNSWHFISNDHKCSITLYYQPIIHNQVTLPDINGIQLRTIQNQNQPLNKRQYAHYTPDFLIKIERNQKTAYCIIDSKWKLAGPPPAKDNAFEDINDCYFKYIQSMGTITPRKNCIHQGNTIEGLWLLAGKNHYPKSADASEIIMSRPNSKAMIHPDYFDSLQYGCGVLPLTPETIDTDGGKPRALIKLLNDIVTSFPM